mmetsp:Transcript_61198/g.167789  ORF Transcript_61198/g.167789 Transcript_61198/m.167789 type:complete len:165 (+) Transcript_61198:1877-2371(+)
MARLYYDRNNKASTEGLHVQLYLEKLQAEDPIVSQADDYLMCGRVAVMLRGFGDALHQPRSMWPPLLRPPLPPPRPPPLLPSVPPRLIYSRRSIHITRPTPFYQGKCQDTHHPHDHPNHLPGTAQAWLPFAEALLREAGELPPAAPAEVQRRAKLARRNSRLHK